MSKRARERGDKRDRWQEPQDQQPEPAPAGSFMED